LNVRIRDALSVDGTHRHLRLGFPNPFLYVGSMKAFLGCILVGASVVLAGCGKDSGDSASGENPLSAPADYVGAAARAHQQAGRTVDLASLQQAIQQFHIMKGRPPKDLKELVSEGHLSRLPDPPRGMRFDYDPATGNIRAVPAE
jgi:hypothetical protein